MAPLPPLSLSRLEAPVGTPWIGYSCPNNALPKSFVGITSARPTDGMTWSLPFLPPLPFDLSQATAVRFSVPRVVGGTFLEREILSAQVTGPFAETIRGHGSWRDLFGVEWVEGRHQVKWAGESRNGDRYVTKLVLYEDGRPRIALISRTGQNGEATELLRLEVVRADGEVALKLTPLNPDATPFSSSVQQDHLRIEEGKFVLQKLRGGQADEIAVGIMTFRGRWTLTVQDREGRLLLYAPPLSSSQDVEARARAFEDMAGVAPYLPAAFQHTLEREMRKIFKDLAERPIGDRSRRALTRAVEESPYSMRGRLLDYLLREDFSARARDYAAHLVFGRRYRQWGELLHYQVLEDSCWAAHVTESSTDRELAAVLKLLGDSRSVEEDLRHAFRKILEQGRKWEVETDAVLDLVLSESGWQGLETIAGASDGDQKKPVISFLEKMFNRLLSEEEFREKMRGRLWMIRLEVSHGPGKKPTREAFRNRVLHEQKWREWARYHTRLPGTVPFAHDPSLSGVDPLFVYGLDRLGEYKEIEPIPSLQDPEVRVLLLHGETKAGDKTTENRHYYLTAVVPPGVGIEPSDQMPQLLDVHRRLTEELAAQLKNKQRWPEGSKTPDWNRLSVQIQGVVAANPEDYERAIRTFADQSQPQRGDLFLEKTVVEATLQYRDHNNEFRQVVAITGIEDISDNLSVVTTRYLVHVSAEGEAKKILFLVSGDTYRRLLENPDTVLKKGEWHFATRQIRDKSDVDRRRALANRAGATFFYYLPDVIEKAARQLWAGSGSTVPSGPVLEMEGELVPENGGKMGVLKRDAGLNTTGAVGLVVKGLLPTLPQGGRFALVGHDTTHPSGPTGAVNLGTGMMLAAMVDYAADNGLPVIYSVDTTGAMMGLPDFLVPRRGDDLPVQLDEKGVAYLPSQNVAKILETLQLPIEKVFLGEWREIGGEGRFYPSALLKGGVNIESLRGSARSAGAFARAAVKVPTIGVLPSRKGFATGIGLYNFRLCQILRAQSKGSTIMLTGFNAINRMYGHKIFTKVEELTTAEMMREQGMSTDLFDNEVDGFQLALGALIRQSPIPDVRKLRALPEMSSRAERGMSVSEPRDIGPIIDGLIRQQREKKAKQPAGYYDTREELKALVDPGSFVEVKGKTHHAIMGFARKNGYPVAVWGIQMLHRFEMNEKGNIKIVDGRPQGEIGMTLPAEAAGELASFIESLPPWMPIVSVPAAKGYDPRTVAASGEKGARLASAQALHPALQAGYIGRNKVVLGGMYVTIAPDLSREGRIRLYAHPNATIAVLDIPGWSGIGFYKSTQDNVARILLNKRGIVDPSRADQKVEEDCERQAASLVNQVIGWMSHIRRAEQDGAVTAVVEECEISERLSADIAGWYDSNTFRKLYADYLSSNEFP